MAPWKEELVEVYHDEQPIIFDNIKIFDAHVTIPPHDVVSSAKHRYSFTENGKHICFHSPIALPENELPLSNFLLKLYDKFLSDEKRVTNDNMSTELAKIIELTSSFNKDAYSSSFPNPRDGFLGWLEWGHFLRKTYSIMQYAIIEWDKPYLPTFDVR